ncbi:MAG: putative metal-binding motif-containing protein [Myxococcaceae bacterium]|nr:putative metal-binding motif-containing protein [Myxococcaceae bacterium]
MLRSSCLLLLCVGCSSSVPGPLVRSVDPREVFQQATTPVTITGQLRASVKVDFQRDDGSTRSAQFTAQLERGDVVVDLTEVVFVESGILQARVPAGLELGGWALVVTDPLQRQARLDDAVVVVDCRSSSCRLADGGVLDAGPLPRDAGVDGGLIDGGALDAGPVDAGPQPCGQLTFKDDDLDGFGEPGSEAMLCGAARTMSGGDCDDLDPGVHTGAREFCNRVDDDCDGQVDEGACPLLNPNWIRRLDATTSQDWRTVSMFARGAGWIAGRDDVWGRLDGGFFEPSSASCPNDITKSWASPTGDLYVAGGNPALGRLATHLRAAPGCMDLRMLSDPLAGFWGVEVDGGLRLKGVLRNTRSFELTPGGSAIESSSNLSGSVRLADAHQANGVLVAVGSEAGEMRAYTLDADGGWGSELIGALPNGSLQGVSVLSATSVFAVGDQGVVLEKVGTAWRRLPAPTTATLTSVLAFNPARVFVTSSDGAVRKWNARGWQTLYSNDGGAPLNDLHGVVEDDLWAVGDRGWLVHWPE